MKSLFRRFTSNKLATDASKYVGAIALARVPAFIFLPAYASNLPIWDFGRYITALILLDLFQAVASLGMIQALGRFLPLAQSRDETRKILGTALSASLLSCAILTVFALSVFSVPVLRNSLEISRSLSGQALLLVLAAGNAGTFASLLMARFRAEQRSSAFLAAQVAGAVAEAALAGWMVLAKRVDLDAILWIEVIRMSATAAIAALLSATGLTLRFDFRSFAAMFKYGIWLVPVALFFWVSLSIDRFWLGQLAGLEMVGIYGFFYKFAAPLSLVFQGYIISLDSHLFRSGPEAGRELVRRILPRYLAAGGALAVAAGMAIPAAILWATRSLEMLPATYLRGLGIYPLMVANLYVFNWMMHYASLLEFQFRARRQLANMGAGSIATFLLSFAFIRFGPGIGWDAMSGAVLANLAASAVLLCIQMRSAAAGRVPGGAWAAAAVLALLFGLSFLFGRAA